MFVGYTLAVLSILDTAKVAVALLVLGVPIIDTFWIIVRRIDPGARRSRRTAATSTTGCWTSACRTARRCWSSTGCASCSRCLSLVLSGTQQLYSFMGLALIFGLVLFLLNRNETSDALEAETYDEEPEGRA